MTSTRPAAASAMGPHVIPRCPACGSACAQPAVPGLRSRCRGTGAGRAARGGSGRGCDMICRRSALFSPQGDGPAPGEGPHGRMSTTTWSAEADHRLRTFLATHELSSGGGPEEPACSLVAINLALTGRPSRAIPDCMSAGSAIGSSISRPRCRARSAMEEPGRTCFRGLPPGGATGSRNVRVSCSTVWRPPGGPVKQPKAPPTMPVRQPGKPPGRSGMPPQTDLVENGGSIYHG